MYCNTSRGDKGQSYMNDTLTYTIGYYKVNLVTFEIQRVTYTFKKLDKESKKRMLDIWLR